MRLMAMLAFSIVHTATVSSCARSDTGDANGTVQSLHMTRASMLFSTHQDVHGSMGGLRTVMQQAARMQ